MSAAPDVEAYTAISKHDASGTEVRRILDGVATDDLLQVEMHAVRLIWAARDLRRDRQQEQQARS